MKRYQRQLIFLFLAFPLSFFRCAEDDPQVLINKLQPRAGADQTVATNSTVVLDGSGSADGNNKPFTFLWSFKNKPQASTAVIENPTAAATSFVADVPGVYMLDLKIVQGDFSKSDEISITVTSDPGPQPITIRENITSPVHLENIFDDPAKPDYTVASDLVVTSKLTIAPGVVMEFEYDRSLQINPGGALIAKGTGSESIIFTGKSKTKGYWKGIVFFSNHDDNELDHVYVVYAGSNPLPEMGTIKTNVALAGNETSGSAAKISNSNFHESGGYGVYVAGMSQLNYFFGNYFTNNTSSALYVPARQLHQLDFHSHYTGNNGYNGVETSGSVQQSEAVTWGAFNDGSKYLVSDDLSIESGVQISAGATFEFGRNISLQVIEAGYLSVMGTEHQPVSFTATIKSPDNYWKGITFETGHELNLLRHAVVSHAGYSFMSTVNTKANVAITSSGKLSVLNSKIETGLGWGLVADEGAQFNTDVMTSNSFYSLAEGKYKLPFSELITASLAGEWLDMWSLNNKHNLTRADFYDQASNTWFGGAADPWTMTPQTGFGLKINADGSYLWTIAERSPSTPECVSYSAEYISGNLLASGDKLSFEESYWRSKFYLSCDPEQNADTNVQPGSMMLRYEIQRTYDLLTGDAYWQLKIINPDNSSFTYYKKDA